MRIVHIFLVFFVVINIQVCCSQHNARESGMLSQEEVNRTTIAEPEKAYLKHRKMSTHGLCTNRDISVSQTLKSTSGIPQFFVEIANLCTSGCAPSNIRLHCGWFASARMVNPRDFKRLYYDDCLVYGGRHMKSNQIISFTYSNTYKYPLALKSAVFC